MMTVGALPLEFLALGWIVEPFEHQLIPAVGGELCGELRGIGLAFENEVQARFSGRFLPAESQILPADPPHADAVSTVDRELGCLETALRVAEDGELPGGLTVPEIAHLPRANSRIPKAIVIAMTIVQMRGANAPFIFE